MITWLVEPTETAGSVETPPPPGAMTVEPTLPPLTLAARAFWICVASATFWLAVALMTIPVGVPAPGMVMFDIVGSYRQRAAVIFETVQALGGSSTRGSAPVGGSS